ncbi:MAG: glutathione S-transferase, partial [Rhizobiales bacterium 32-66-8]
DAALLVRYEDTARPEGLRLEAWRAGQMTKIAAALDAMEASHARFADSFTIGGITFACALGYLDFRFPALDWRAGRPQITGWFAQMSQRDSVQRTVPKDAPRP